MAGTAVCGRAIRFVVYFFGLRHEPLENFGEFLGHRHLRVGRDEPLVRCVRVFRIALRELLVFLLSYGTSQGVLALALARPSPSRRRFRARLDATQEGILLAGELPP